METIIHFVDRQTLFADLFRVWFSVGVQDLKGAGEEFGGGDFPHFSIAILDDGQTEKVVHYHDSGVGPVHGTQSTQRFL